MKQQFYITGTQTRKITVEISRTDLAYALMDVIQDMIGPFDDAGCDLFTNDSGEIFTGGNEKWIIGKDAKVACLVDSMNILKYGNALYHK